MIHFVFCVAIYRSNFVMMLKHSLDFVALAVFVCIYFSLSSVGVLAEEYTPCTHRSCLSCELIAPILHIDSETDETLIKLAHDQYEKFKIQGAKLYDLQECVFSVIPVGFKDNDKTCGLRLNILRECKPGLKCKNRQCVNPKLDRNY